MIKLYIAFSIHGTKAFIRASREVTEKEYQALLESGEFVPVPSRRPHYDAIKDGIKLAWSQLKTGEGQPLRAVPRILNRFNLLAKQGWVVHKQAFVEKHYHGKSAASVSR